MLGPSSTTDLDTLQGEVACSGLTAARVGGRESTGTPIARGL
jgi:hypothetical protein